MKNVVSFIDTKSIAASVVVIPISLRGGEITSLDDKRVARIIASATREQCAREM